MSFSGREEAYISIGTVFAMTSAASFLWCDAACCLAEGTLSST